MNKRRHNLREFVSNTINEEFNKTKKIVYHASPHLFDKFSTKYMGSGEGAQAYGWGLYFTDDEKVLDYYLNTILPLKPPSMIYLVALKRLIELASSSKFGSGGNRKKIDLEKLEYYLNNPDGKFMVGNNGDGGVIKTWLKNTLNNVDLNKLITYKYTVSIDCLNFVDFNDKLTKINYTKILNKISDIGLKIKINYDDIFRIIYNNISNEIGERETSLLLNEIGICGIQYSTKNNKNNYVVFDDNNINIINVDLF
jgi:hypothetical protein